MACLKFEGDFGILHECLSCLRNIQVSDNISNYTKDEILKFYSIAGSVLEHLRKVGTCIDERHLVHILLRPLFESFIWLAYIYLTVDAKKQETRFKELVSGFKKQYAMLHKDFQNYPRITELCKPGQLWEDSKSLKVKDIENKVQSIIKNHHHDNRDLLIFHVYNEINDNINDKTNNLSTYYLWYRIMCFDTHGITSNSLFCEAFQTEKTFDLTYIKPKYYIELIANTYLSIMQHNLGIKGVSKYKNFDSLGIEK